LLQVLDLHSTLRAAGAGRSETNPMILWMTSHVGFTAAVTACKAAALAIIGSYYAAVSNFNRMRWPAITLIPVCVIYLAVVLNNYS
jgi:hypothetical protein